MPLSDPGPRRGPGTLIPLSIEAQKWEEVRLTEYRWRPGHPPSIWEIVEEIQAGYREQAQRLKGTNTMPLKDPTVAGIHFEEGRYLLKLTDMLDTEPSTEHPEWGPGLLWVIAVHDADREPILDEDGKPAFITPRSSQSTAPKSKARPWIQAFIGREIENNDTGAGLQAEALGKWAWGLIGDNDKGFSSVLSMSAVKKGKAAPKDDDD